MRADTVDKLIVAGVTAMLFVFTLASHAKANERHVGGFAVLAGGVTSDRSGNVVVHDGYGAPAVTYRSGNYVSYGYASYGGVPSVTIHGSPTTSALLGLTYGGGVGWMFGGTTTYFLGNPVGISINPLVLVDSTRRYADLPKSWVTKDAKGKVTKVTVPCDGIVIDYLDGVQNERQKGC